MAYRYMFIYIAIYLISTIGSQKQWLKNQCVNDIDQFKLAFVIYIDI